MSLAKVGDVVVRTHEAYYRVGLGCEGIVEEVNQHCYRVKIEGERHLHSWWHDYCAPAPIAAVNAETDTLNDGARFPSPLPNDSAARKEYPLFDVLFGQFPAAVTALAHHSYNGNQKHNPGQPIQHARNKSTDHQNCILRHLMEGDYEAVVWRSMALLQEKLEEEGAPVAPRATFE